MKPVIQLFVDVARTALLEAPHHLTQREAQCVVNVVIQYAKAYAGRPDYRAFMNSAMPKVVVPRVEKILADRQKLITNATQLAGLYAHRRVLQKGIRTGLTRCVDLGADLGTEENFGADVLEVESAAWMKIAADLPAWVADGDATIDTRLFAYGLVQARGWQTARLREREKRNKILTVMRDYGLGENKGGGYEERV